jgi:predicted PhzF superfamily epimerase YddE/YHI9
MGDPSSRLIEMRVRKMTTPVFQVDAFSSQPFAGNPAAVCLLADSPDDAWLQAVAAEMNLSETAFLQPRSDGYSLRWFTPKVEVDLCGHATLASAHVLWTEGHLPRDQEIRFHTRSGQLKAACRGELIELDFPAEPAAPVSPPPGLLEALQVEALFVGRNRFDYLVELGSEAKVRVVQPDYVRLGQLDVRGVIITSCCATPDYDFVSHFFAPAAGVNEDPVTGSAHCCLGPYWSTRLAKSELRGYQASSRGGVVQVRLAGPRVILGGHAVTVLKGCLV